MRWKRNIRDHGATSEAGLQRRAHVTRSAPMDSGLGLRLNPWLPRRVRIELRRRRLGNGENVRRPASLPHARPGERGGKYGTRQRSATSRQEKTDACGALQTSGVPSAPWRANSAPALWFGRWPLALGLWLCSAMDALCQFIRVSEAWKPREAAPSPAFWPTANGQWPKAPVAALVAAPCAPSVATFSTVLFETPISASIRIENQCLPLREARHAPSGTAHAWSSRSREENSQIAGTRPFLCFPARGRFHRSLSQALDHLR